MNYPLKREVSINKMLSQRNLRLRRIDVVGNSFGSRVSDAAKELSRAPEVSFSKIISEPGMFLQKFKGRIALKQLNSLADTHGKGATQQTDGYSQQQRTVHRFHIYVYQQPL